MKFSKLKKTVESFLCDSLKGRVELHAAVYRHAHDQPSRVWLTFDKKQLFSAEDLTFTIQHYTREQQLKENLQLKSIPYSDNWQEMFNSPERQALLQVSDRAEQELLDNNIIASWHLYQMLLNYPHLSIDEALASNSPYIRAFALFDRRVGKRRLLNINQPHHPLEIMFFQIRKEVENM
ncbi:nonribosomal peptide synthetase [Lysinibacillus sp. BW-2-10]|uniref:SF0329 family protein n=1 Tax=Lysinibacillus sp. BW-2-10 TaxID=2590030 RepID=UPI00117DABCD|nr:nonribosomal peptide synthetase [Lysinibacillus sp. BW-2-10]TSI11682.1 nonribosomal peptide synthetase [Lysinibacillus sp. BW-2-10]